MMNPAMQPGMGSPYSGAKNDVNQYNNAANQADQQGANLYDPYITNGENAAGGLQGIEGQFANPEAAFNNWAAN